ncbi:hypothetical protein KIN20_029778 [Parelaphostrongylus tenuis]|uniref:Uncharacterized protein n=1 Tax=Parelaphostrongylus tenuis TaxID=148309 RepID=A0AAD5R3T4_PARTN|nr:hypothetical protein KIN20_029778 [Parelaphostrongylus tenuis]
MILLLFTISTVLGCGVMPAGRGDRMKILTDPAKLPTNYVIITSLAAITVVLGCGVTPTGQVAGISTSKRQAQTFVEQLVMETVIVVLESQGRSALLPEEVISAILRQLTVHVIYEPLLCQKVFLKLPGGDNIIENLKENCIIAGGNTVTGICRKNGGNMMCEPAVMTTLAIPPQHLSISGTTSF